MSDEAVKVEPAPVAEEDTVVALNGPPRFKTVPLTFSATYRGRTYKQIGIKRLTKEEVTNFIASVKAEGRDADELINFPMFIDDDGALVPEIVLNKLDVDDADTLMEAALDFLPRRFRASIPEPATAPMTGDTIEPSSGA